jgi:hypothetical protein
MVVIALFSGSITMNVHKADTNVAHKAKVETVYRV